VTPRSGKGRPPSAVSRAVLSLSLPAPTANVIRKLAGARRETISETADYLLKLGLLAHADRKAARIRDGL
jgi:hypothetical protein